MACKTYLLLANTGYHDIVKVWLDNTIEPESKSRLTWSDPRGLVWNFRNPGHQTPMLKRFGLKTMNYFLPLSDFLKLYSQFRLYFFFLDWLIVQSRKPKSSVTQWNHPGIGGNFSQFYERYLQPWSQGLEKVIPCAFCTPQPPTPPPLLCNHDQTLSSNTSLHFIIFQLWKGNEGADTYSEGITVMISCFCIFSNTICPWL